MEKKTEKELLEYIKLKDKLELLNKTPIFEKKIKNPFETLTFNSQETEIKNKKKKITSSYQFWFLVLVVLSLTVSIFFNGLISSRFDPIVYKFINSLLDQVNKPYVVTIGDFKTFEIAKSKAIELLPQLRQINIEQLPTGNYTFEIDKCSSKEKAYSISREFIRDGFESVHVRYLPNQ